MSGSCGYLSCLFFSCSFLSLCSTLSMIFHLAAGMKGSGGEHCHLAGYPGGGGEIRSCHTLSRVLTV